MSDVEDALDRLAAVLDSSNEAENLYRNELADTREASRISEPGLRTATRAALP